MRKAWTQQCLPQPSMFPPSTPSLGLVLPAGWFWGISCLVQVNHCFAMKLLELLRICDNILKIFSSREGETEEERISKMMSNSTEMYSDKHWVKFKVSSSKKPCIQS